MHQKRFKMNQNSEKSARTTSCIIANLKKPGLVKEALGKLRDLTRECKYQNKR